MLVAVFLHAEFPRYFTRMLEDVTVSENQNAILSCEVFPEDSKVTWYINGDEIISSDRVMMWESGAERTLEVSRAKRTDAGQVFARVGTQVTTAMFTVEGMYVVWSQILHTSSHNTQWTHLLKIYILAIIS